MLSFPFPKATEYIRCKRSKDATRVDQQSIRPTVVFPVASIHEPTQLAKHQYQHRCKPIPDAENTGFRRQRATSAYRQYDEVGE